MRRIAMISVHTSPLEQPGRGDAGGLNVYVDAVARRLARRGVEVDVFTRATSSQQPQSVEVEPGYLVRNVLAGPYGGVAKEDLPALLCPFAAQVLRAATPRLASTRPAGTIVMQRPWYDVIHSHYWLSGLVGQVARERWALPLVHSAHTLARVKNASLAGDDDRREPRQRELGEAQVTAEADVLVAPTRVEAQQLVDLYSADERRITVVPPGVDVNLFRPAGSQCATDSVGCAGDAMAHRAAVRADWGLAGYEIVLGFVGRIQPHKGPDVVVRTLAELRRRHPGRSIGAVIIGNSSGSGHREPEKLAALAAAEGVADHVRLLPATPAAELAAMYRGMDVVLVPSHSESFGLVALEAQACGTPVVAAAVGGLPVAVDDGVSGLLVHDRSAQSWADAVGQVVLHPQHRQLMSLAAREQAEEFSWEATVERLLAVYRRAMTGTVAEVTVHAGVGA